MELRWTKKFIAGEAFESARFVDIDGDGVIDIASGGFWYQGPEFERRHSIADVPRVGDYYDDFGSVAMDIAGNGRADLVTGGWWGGALRWRENPVTVTRAGSSITSPTRVRSSSRARGTWTATANWSSCRTRRAAPCASSRTMAPTGPRGCCGPAPRDTGSASVTSAVPVGVIS